MTVIVGVIQEVDESFTGVRDRIRKGQAMRTNLSMRMMLLGGGLVVSGLLQAACAQTYAGEYTPAYPSANYPTNYTTYTQPQVTYAPPVAERLTDAQIDQLVAPIALYPDPLLAQVLPAATYPTEIVLAQRWLAANPQPSEQAIDVQSWDSSIKALVHYPTVLQNMNDHLEWTQALGAAFVNQQEDVMASVQRLRLQAQAAGTLQTTAQQEVFADNGAVCIEPARPDVIYVPVYDPQIVYVERPVYERPAPIFFGIGLQIGGWLNNDCDWGHRYVSVGANWRHDHDRDVRTSAGRDIRGNGGVQVTRTTINNTVIHGNTNRATANTGRPWTHNVAKPIPMLPTAHQVRPMPETRFGQATQGRTLPPMIRPAAPTATVQPSGSQAVRPLPNMERRDRALPAPAAAPTIKPRTVEAPRPVIHQAAPTTTIQPNGPQAVRQLPNMERRDRALPTPAVVPTVTPRAIEAPRPVNHQAAPAPRVQPAAPVAPQSIQTAPVPAIQPRAAEMQRPMMTQPPIRVAPPQATAPSAPVHVAPAAAAPVAAPAAPAVQPAPVRAASGIPTMRGSPGR